MGDCLLFDLSGVSIQRKARTVRNGTEVTQCTQLTCIALDGKVILQFTVINS